MVEYTKYKVVEVIYPTHTKYEIHGWNPSTQLWCKYAEEGVWDSKEDAVARAVDLTYYLSVSTPIGTKDVWP